METKKSQLLRHMRRVVQKVKFLLSFNATRWIFSPAPRTPRRLSFRTQQSLLDCTDQLNDVASPSWASRASSFSGPVISRTSSSVSAVTRTDSDVSTPRSADDVDRRAEAFIANFYQHIQMERQVSLELRYCKRK